MTQKTTGVSTLEYYLDIYPGFGFLGCPDALGPEYRDAANYSSPKTSQKTYKKGRYVPGMFRYVPVCSGMFRLVGPGHQACRPPRPPADLSKLGRRWEVGG